ncbi:MAG TPA: YihY/virulence factor BrkB family protein [Thermoanaerobaculia bacterium]|nr:YihY/virulence factor BrkB family protein [Thermoanaerobaculia bacterium]
MSDRPRLGVAIRKTYAEFERHNASRFGAALAFYIVFSVAPILLFTIAIAGSILGREQAEREIIERVGSSIGTAPALAIAAMVSDAAARPVGWLATIFGVMTLYFGLSGVYRQIDDALRTIWREKKSGDASTVAVIEKRVRSVLLVLGVVVVICLSVIADAVIAATGRYAGTRLLGAEWLWHTLSLLVSTLVLTVIFAAVFRYLPRARVTWRDVVLGAAVTAFLFVIGKFALGFYLGKAAVGSAFGAAGSIVVVLLWSYWSAQIFFFGLEFTHVYARGTRSENSPTAS